jgi:Zn finger protein HypA/HybF involved in hydrogenase expression
MTLSLEGHAIVARFHLNMRCDNCRQVVGTVLNVPDVEDAPTEVDDLLHSELLHGMKFKCSKCESPTAIVIGVKHLHADARDA